MACLTLAHSVIVCAQQAFSTEVFLRWLHAKETNWFVYFLKLWIYSASLLESALYYHSLLIHLSL